MGEQMPSKISSDLNDVKRQIAGSGDSIALMYSGGKDSSAVLCTMTDANPNADLYLLICNNGHFYPEELKSIVLRNISAVKDAVLMRNHVSAFYFDCREVLMNLGMRSLHEDVKKYPTSYLCCACKLVMHCVCAAFCQANGILLLFDGYNRKQRYYPEQVPCFHDAVAETLHSLYSVQASSPLYSILSERGSSDRLLHYYGLDAALFDREKGGQAPCSLGGNFRAPRTSTGEVDGTFYDEFERGVKEYTWHKIQLLCSKDDLVQYREGGILRKQSYQHQILAASRKYERIL